MTQGLIPATILTGFLGSGKTTLLKRVLSEVHGQKIAVIENEFGEENIDNDILVADTEEHIVQMSNGCVCCTIREDLRETLSDLVKQKKAGTLNFERVVIETTGLADPGPVAQTFFMDDEIAEHYLLDAIVTLVDAKHGDQQLDTRQEARRQVGFADLIFMSKADLVSPEQADALAHRIKHMNPRAPQKRVHFGEVPIKEVFDLKGFNLNAKLDIDPEFLSGDGHGAHDHDHHDHDHHHHDHAPSPIHDVTVMSISLRGGEMNPDRFFPWIQKVTQTQGPNILRLKGIIAFKGDEERYVVQGVHMIIEGDHQRPWKDGEKRESRLVFIGRELDREKLEASFKACEATA